MSFISSDLKSLQYKLPALTPHTNQAANRRFSAFLTSRALKPMFTLEEMLFRSDILHSSALALQEPLSNTIQSHVELLYKPYVRCSDGKPAGLARSKITSIVLDDLSGPLVQGLTSKAFWTQIMMAAFVRLQSTARLPTGNRDTLGGLKKQFDDTYVPCFGRGALVLL
ncbi:hypothetical protein K432DRAFT_410979 [Lepidopterella palustris CBS 459.81]|uniref:Uncharacterized protein n=1 Tax=Lepidopterella palustris CBS 459.81 TaxID=1314670 RepID=A0A8E2DWQ0_9PEZI|nr:hypothetical protein K432DRAFT_410979 [Lepidopterella palustris CBS 459.81]